jgi:hypothetical protein
LKGSTTPLLIVYFMPLHGDYIQMSLFLETPKTRTIVVPKLWTFIYFSNHFFVFGNARAISNNPQNDLFNDVLHTLI